MRILVYLSLVLTLSFCTPKGPITYKSSFVGQSKADLIHAKGIAKTIKVYDQSELYIYKVKEEYFGKNVSLKTDSTLIPKKTYTTEHIYHIDKTTGIVTKYQVWKKKIKKTKNQQ